MFSHFSFALFFGQCSFYASPVFPKGKKNPSDGAAARKSLDDKSKKKRSLEDVVDLEDEEDAKPEKPVGFWQRKRREKREAKSSKTAAKEDAVKDAKIKGSEAKSVSGLEIFIEMEFDMDQSMVGVKLIHYHGWLLSETLSQGVMAALQAGHRTGCFVETCQLYWLTPITGAIRPQSASSLETMPHLWSATMT